MTCPWDFCVVSPARSFACAQVEPKVAIEETTSSLAMPTSNAGRDHRIEKNYDRYTYICLLKFFSCLICPRCCLSLLVEKVIHS